MLISSCPLDTTTPIQPSGPKGRDLVLVRIGADHRMTSLLHTTRAERSWDLALSLYGDITLSPESQVDHIHYYRGGKWDGIHDFFLENGELLDRYDYFWLVDDDIETAPGQVDALFRYVRAHELELAQPALTPDSYHSHRLTLCCPGFAHRYTNLVEIMAPILSQHVLQRVLPLFAHTRSGFGIDWYWQRAVDSPRKAIAIIDAEPVSHRRQLRRHLRGAMRRDGYCPIEEREALMQRLKVKKIYAIATSGLLASGEQVPSRYRMVWRMTFTYWKTRNRVTARPWTMTDLALFWWRQLMMPLGR